MPVSSKMKWVVFTFFSVVQSVLLYQPASRTVDIHRHGRRLGHRRNRRASSWCHRVIG